MNDDLIEKMARAICLAQWGHLRGFNIYHKQYMDGAHAALAAIHGEYVVLPREPTKAIQDALIDAVRDGIAINDDIHRTARHAYRAMIREGEIK